MMSSYTLASVPLENKVVRAALASNMCDPVSGIPDQNFYNFYESVAKGHPGLLIMEMSFVSQSGRAPHKELSICNDDMIQYHKKAVDIMKAANPKQKICCELSDAGTRGSSADKIDINIVDAKILQQVVADFKAGAMRAKQAGYDFVEVHAGHTLLISQSISSFYNKRTDEYASDKYKLLKDIYDACKTCGLPVGVKLQGDDYIEGHTCNAASTVKILQQLQFDFVEITGGGPDGKQQTIRQTQDKYYYKHVIDELKKNNLLNKQPVIVTGGFLGLKDAENALNDGVQMVGFGRKFVRNTQFLVGKDDKECDHCNGCVRAFFKGEAIKCVYE